MRPYLWDLRGSGLGEYAQTQLAGDYLRTRHVTFVTPLPIDGQFHSGYPDNGRSLLMAVKSVQLGQVWRRDQDGRSYLVTKIYNEVFTQFAMLRQAGLSATTTDTIRVKVQKGSDGAMLPGYTFTQEGQF